MREDLLSELTNDEVSDMIRVMKLSKAFHGKVFNAEPLRHQLAIVTRHDELLIRLVNEAHNQEFDNMSERMKRTLWQACLKMSNVSEQEFPYPIHQGAH